MSVVAVPPFLETLDGSQANSGGFFPEKLPGDQSSFQNNELERFESIKKARTLVAYKYQGKLGLSKIEVPTEGNSLSPYSCDPLLRFIDPADFKDDEKLQRNFEHILRIRKMGFPVKIFKQNWFPGLICIPVFHCQRCLALWMEVAQVPTLCSEVNRSVYGRILPVSVTKCDLLTKLFKRDRNETVGGRGSRKTQSPSANTHVEKTAHGENNEAAKRESCREKVQTKAQPEKKLRQPPVAEFVDIEEETRRIREKVLRKIIGQETTTLKSRSGYEDNSAISESSDETSASQQGGTASASCDKGERKDEKNGIKEDLVTDGEEHAAGGQRRNHEMADDESDFKGSSERDRNSAALEKKGKSNRRPGHSGRRSSSCSRQKEAGHFARPPTRTSQRDTKKQFYGGLYISSKQNGDRGEVADYSKKTDQWTKHLRRHNEDVTKFRRSLPHEGTLAGIAASEEHRDEAEFLMVDELKKLTENGEVDEERLQKIIDDSADEDHGKWTRTAANERSFGDEMMMTQPISMRLFNWDVTRAFRFSYFSLLRKVKKHDKL